MVTDCAAKILPYDERIRGYFPFRQFNPLWIDFSASACVGAFKK